MHQPQPTLAVNEVKIDKTFVMTMSEDTSNEGSFGIEEGLTYGIEINRKVDVRIERT